MQWNYRHASCIGFASFHTLIFGSLYFLKDYGLKPLEFAYDHYVGLAFASIIFSYAISLGCYLGSFGEGKVLALGGNTGNPIYDVSHMAILTGGVLALNECDCSL